MANTTLEGLSVRKTVVAAFLVASLAAFAAAPPVGWQRVIEELGSSEEVARKAAAKKLIALGEDALPALRKAGRSHADPDVRLRAFVLAASIEKQLDRTVRVFQGHTEGVLGLAVSPDGKRIASGAWQNGTEHVGRVWDVATGKELFQLVGHTACVGGVAWSSDGKRIVTGGNDGCLMVWDAQSGKRLKRFSGTTSAMWSISLSPDGKKVVTCGFQRGGRGGVGE